MSEWLARLDRVKQSGRGFQALCPAHDDRNPSLSLIEADDGGVIPTCFAGCERLAIHAAVFGNSISAPKRTPALAARRNRHKPQPLPSAGPNVRLWKYHDAAGKIAFAVVRRDPGKRFTQWVPTTEPGLWLPEGPKGLRPLYRLPDLLEADVIHVVEGEKDADAVRHSWDVVSTTWSGGVANWNLTDWQPLAGKHVLLISDADDDAALDNPNAIDRPGQTYMLQVANHLHNLGCSVKVAIPPPGGKADVSDWITRDGPAVARDYVQAILKPFDESMIPEAPPDPPPPSNSPAALGGYRGLMLSVEARAAEYAADALRSRFRYDGYNWYAWQRNAWRLGVSASDVLKSLVHDRYRLAASASEAGETEVAQLLASSARSWNGAISAPVRDFQSALHIALLRPTPKLNHSLIATPSAVVNWETGERTDLDPRLHDVTASTCGEYRPAALRELTTHLRKRLSHAFTEDECTAFATMLGLAVTRWDIDPSILWLTGPSGSGKSWIAQLVQAAFSDLAHEGLARRVEAFAFEKAVNNSLKANAERTQRDLDAIGTVSVEEARQLHQQRELGTHWERPRGNATRLFLATADDLASWLADLGDELHGQPISDVCALYERSTGEKLTPRSLGRHLRTHPKWTSARDTTGTKIRRLVLRNELLA